MNKNVFKQKVIRYKKFLVDNSEFLKLFLELVKIILIILKNKNCHETIL